MKIGCDGEHLNIDWNPAAYKTKAGAAKGLYKALRKACESVGMNPNSEVWIKAPEESLEHGYVGKVWHVSWESGPYNWGCSVFAHGEWGHCEPYWGFDLAFYE